MTKYAKDPIKGEFKDICAGAIGGIMGSGKTTTACFIACQLAVKHARLVVIDPHGNASITNRKETLGYNLEPLSDCFLCNIAIDDDDILASVELVSDRLRSRKRGQDNTSYPVFLFLDEFSSVMRSSVLAGEISILLEDIATEGRKFKVGAMLLGQQWHVGRSGGGPLRDVLASAYVHRMKRRVARMLIDDVDDTSTLKDGEAWLFQSKFGITKIQVPLTTYADVVQVGALLKSRVSHRRQSNLKPQINPSLSEPSAPNVDLPTDPIKRRVIELFLAGNNIPYIVREVFRAKSGQPYNSASDEVNEIIREFVLQGMLAGGNYGNNGSGSY